MSMGIGRYYIIRRDITTKLYIMHYGYVIEVIVKYCENTYVHPQLSYACALFIFNETSKLCISPER